MTDEKRAALLKIADRHTRANTTSQQAARALLVREGIYTQEGRLAPEYGGEADKQRRQA